jgi:YYY domain-containing protein
MIETGNSPGCPASTRSLRSLFRRYGVALGLFALLSLSLGLRLWGINWDQGGLFHPDERAFLFQVQQIHFPDLSQYSTLRDKIDAFRSPDSPLNPGSFNWGSLPHYMLKSIQYAAQLFMDRDLTGWDLRFPGRALSAIGDTFTVALVFLIGWRWFSLRTGFLAAGMIAMSVIDIQLSHFWAVDTLMTTFITATVLFAIRVAHHGRYSDAALTGLMAGLAFATKFSVSPLAVAVIAGFAIYASSQPGESLETRGWSSNAAAKRQWHAFKGLMIASAVALAAVIVTQPYMFSDFSTFLGNISDQGQMVRRINDWPFTRQYVDTGKYWYQIFQLGFWGVGPVMGLTIWIGLGAGVVFAWFSRRKTDLVIMAWVIPYLLITGWFDVKFMRYMLPLVPFLVIYGARLMWWIGDTLVAIWPQRRYLVAVPAALMLIFTAQYALSFMAIYSGTHPAQAASTWLEANAAPGSKVVQEHWEEGTPHVAGLGYVHEQLPLYDPDSLAKFTKISDLLVESDYLVLYSNRLWGTLPRLPDRYPYSTTYYEKLFGGELGYELAFADTRLVQALGVTFREDQFARVPFAPPNGFEQPSGKLLTISPGWADESFSVYDHPQVLIFKNTGRLERFKILDEIGFNSPTNLVKREPGLMLDDKQLVEQQSGGTWTDITLLRNLPEGLTWVVWLLAVELFALFALPIAFMLFRPFPDRGYLLAKPLGLLLAATATWLMASTGIMNFSFASALVGMLMVGAVSAFVLCRRGSEILDFYRAHRRLVLIAELLFLVAFLSFLAIRFANPDLWHPYRGGEKPMDFAYLNAVLRSSVMPPYDPWFSGGYLNYYYFGQFIVADVIRLTGIVPSIAYNLAVPMLFAFTVGAAFSIIYNLTSLTITARKGDAAKARSPLIAGLVTALLVAVAGNIDGLAQVLGGARFTFGDTLPERAFDFWRSSRMFARDSAGNEITEFPFFSFLFADLHAHMIAIPFALLAVSLSVAVSLRAKANDAVWQSWGRLAVLGTVIGALRIINAWDFPTQLLLAGGAVLAGEMFATHKTLSARFASALLKWIFVALVGNLVYLPFHNHFELFNNGVLKSEFQTPVWRYVVIHSIFLFVIVSWVVSEAWERRFDIQDWIHAYQRRNRVPPWVAPVIGIAFAAAVLTFMVTPLGTIVFTMVISTAIALAAFSVLHKKTPGSRFVLVAAALAVMALALAGGVDVFTVKDDIGRMNTVFKFYLQAWWLLALASGYFLWLMWSAGRFSLRAPSLPHRVWNAVFAVLAIGVMVYPVYGTNVRIRDRFNLTFTGLDGAEYMESAVHFEKNQDGVATPIDLSTDIPGIEWLENNVGGSPVIVEAVTDLYRWGGRVSIYTGLPAVIGWDWHQRQQRVNYSWAVTERRQDVTSFYTTTVLTQAVDFLDRYNVQYVYVGELERITYPLAGIEKFDQMSLFGLTPVFSYGPVTIYEYQATATSLSRSD